MALSNFTLTVSEYCSLEQLPAAFGWHMIGKAVFVTCFGPLIGMFIQQQTANFNWTVSFLQNWNIYSYEIKSIVFFIRFNSGPNWQLPDLHSRANILHIPMLFGMDHWIRHWLHSIAQKWWRQWSKNHWHNNPNRYDQFNRNNTRKHEIRALHSLSKRRPYLN